MVHLVLETGGHETVHLFLVDGAVEILPARADARGAFDVGKDFRHRQAAFLIDRVVFGRIEDFRIDEDPGFLPGRLVRVVMAAVGGADFRFRILVVGLEIDHQHAQRHAHLDGGKTDARGIVHGFE